MKTEPLVSIIIPVYNVEKYLEACVRSVMRQSYQNLQIILVDDGTQDDSGAICDRFPVEDDRIMVIHRENGGLSSARNTGTELAKGDYIAYVDADDYVHSQFVEYLLKACIDSNSKLAICGFEAVYGDRVTETTPEYAVETVTQRELFYHLYSDRNVETVVAWNKLYHRELTPVLHYPVGRQNEDEAIIHQIIAHVPSAARLKAKLYFYRQTDDSITREMYNLKKLDELWSKEERLSFFLEHNMKDLYQKTLYVYCSRIIYHVTRLIKCDNPEYLNAASDYMKKYLTSYKMLSKNNLSIKQRVRLWTHYYVYNIRHKGKGKKQRANHT